MIVAPGSIKRVVLADDHSIVRQGITQVLNDIADVEIVEEAQDGLAAIAAVKMHKPELLILDAAMPFAKGIEVLADSRRWSPETKIILLTGFTAAGILSNWLDAGVDGILLKSCEPKEIRECVEVVLCDAKFVCSEAQAILTETPAGEDLTLREREVLSLVASGYQNLDIATRLNISKRTVEKHRASLMNKLDVTSVAELMVYALKEGLLDGHTQL